MVRPKNAQSVKWRNKQVFKAARFPIFLCKLLSWDLCKIRSSACFSPSAR